MNKSPRSKRGTVRRPAYSPIRRKVHAMDPDEEIELDFSPFIIKYKSGRLQRLGGTSRMSAGTDGTTGVTSKDVVIDTGTGLAARLFLPKGVLRESQLKLPVVVYFHGGAFVSGSAFSREYTRYVNALVAAARLVAVSVEYRLAPEHPVPAAYDDAWAALRWTVASCVPGPGGSEPEPWLADHGDSTKLFVIGSSSGGNMAHNVVMRAGKGGGIQVQGMVLLHPMFMGKDSTHAERSDTVWRFLCAGKYGIDHPFINPPAMPREEWAALGCRRALVTTAALDPFRDRGRRYVEALRGSRAWGGEEDAALYETEGEKHQYYLLKRARSDPVVAKKAADEMATVAKFINRSSTRASDCNIRSSL